MAIEDKLPTREHPSPGQSPGEATIKPSSAQRSERIEARETDTDSPNKEIAKPEFDVTDPRPPHAG